MRSLSFSNLLFLMAGVWSAVAGATDSAVWQDPASGIEFVKVAPGCFEMGEDRPGMSAQTIQFSVPASDEVPRHRVCLDEYWVGRTEVTNEQWQRVLSSESARFVRPQQAVTNVSWHAAQRFVRALSALPRAESANRRFRLPSEAEWEYACHGGNRRPTVDIFSSDGETVGALERWTIRNAWYDTPNLRDQWAHDVAQKSANDWGLHDMLGNVLEWVEDDYSANSYSRHREKNPAATLEGRLKVLRGGSFRSPLERTRCGARFSAPPDDFTPVTGLRVVMELK